MFNNIFHNNFMQFFISKHLTLYNYLRLFRMANISDMRAKYNERVNLLLEDDIPKEPYQLFQKWFNEVRNNPAIIEPNAMCLSTATKDGVPSGRFVLCKDFGKDGFKFFTHYTSRKGHELEENPLAALTFLWHPLSKQVRVEGVVKKLPMLEAESYFSCRPYQSQIGALCSDQSKPIEGRHILAEKEGQLKQLYKEGEVPKPPFWGGYTVLPSSIEFWQGQSDRIHDRIRFRKLNDGEKIDGKLLHKGEDDWVYERLGP